MKLFGVAFFCVGLLFLSGCGGSSTSGNQQLQADKVSQIQKGVTTRPEVEAMFGPPRSVTPWPDGRRTMIYEGMESKSDISGMIMKMLNPFAIFFPTTDTHTFRRQMLQIYLTMDNIVQDYEYSDSTSETKTTSSIFGTHSEQTAVPNASSDSSGK